MRNLSLWIITAALIGIGAPNAFADSATVQSTASIYSTGSGSTLPTVITLSAGASSVTFSSVTGSLTSACGSSEGCISLNIGTGSNQNDPDGVGAAPATSSNTGAGSISGISGPGAGYMVGVFVPTGGPSGAAPASLNFTSSGIGTSFTSLSPLLDQVFYIGDGLTGNGTGTVQQFFVPSGAGTLYLGISDAGFYNGAPGAYGDNAGFYTVDFDVAGANSGGGGTTSAPEPSSLMLIGTGLLGLVSLRRKVLGR
jgi:PEP-CTERM motif-containing protein